MITNKKIIVIDGADGCGKSTQIELLKKDFPLCDFMKFPNYNDYFGQYITNYLNGDLNHIYEELPILEKVKKISLLYTMDRLLWFKTNTHKNLICDRYTTSNIIHMSAIIIRDGGNMEDVYNYIDWLENLEYNILEIPKPNIVLYLDVSYKQSLSNLESRQVLDIHENQEMLQYIDFVKYNIIDYCEWEKIDCIENSKMKHIEDIHKMIYNKIYDIIYS